MASLTNALTRSVARPEQELLAAIDLKDANFSNTERLLTKYRFAGKDPVSGEFALAKETEDSLWAALCTINTLFRKRLTKFRERECRKKHVERRKLEKQYLDFIKSSMRFYRAHVQSLASHFPNIRQVVEVARRFGTDTLSINTPRAVDGSKKILILQSCHASLVRLGDLSRYRETELRSHDRNWGPAKAYYSLAVSVMPASGASYNQLAVIAQTDQNSLQAVYYLHRALMTEVPYPAARPNLEREFKKVRDRWAKEKSIYQGTEDASYLLFQARFVAFHANCYPGINFKEREELESDLIRRFMTALSLQADDSMLNEMCLINIAAELAAIDRLKERGNFSCVQSFRFLRSFNLRLLSNLSESLISECCALGFSMNKKDANDLGQGNEENLTPTLRRLLPLLRHYSTWLLAEASILAAITAHGDPLVPEIQRMWSVYVDALSLLASRFSLERHQSLNYLLPEDEDTSAFRPFINEHTKRRYHNPDGSPKRTFTDSSVNRQSSRHEMVQRIVDLIGDGIDIAQKKYENCEAPLTSTGERFTYKQVTPPQLASEPVHMPTTVASRGSSVAKYNDARDLQSFADSSDLISSEGGAPAAPDVDQLSLHVSTAIHSMVDDLVEEAPENVLDARSQKSRMSHIPSSTAGDASHSKSRPATANELAQGLQHSHSSMSSDSHDRTPGLPITFNAAYSPESGETCPVHTAQPFDTAASQHRFSSGTAFQDSLLQQHQEIQTRSSPQQSLQPSSWLSYDTPASMHSTLLPQQRSSPLRSAVMSEANADEKVNNTLPRRALCGAVGETSGQTPTSAQPNFEVDPGT